MNRILLSVMTVGLTGVLMGAATFALFTSQTVNTANAFETGTLTISSNAA